jgi:hypothetical protein
MRVSYERPLSAESVPVVPYSPLGNQKQSPTGEYAGDEEFPADLPVEYDRLLQSGSGRGFRRALNILAATSALLFAGLSLSGLQRFPKSMLGLGIVLAIYLVQRSN